MPFDFSEMRLDRASDGSSTIAEVLSSWRPLPAEERRTWPPAPQFLPGRLMRRLRRMVRTVAPPAPLVLE